MTTLGQVVTSGQPLMVIVPDEGPLEIETMVLNSDIGFVEPGQDAVVKVDSFPFTRYGVMNAKVLRVSRDAMSDKDAQGASDPVSVGQGQSLPPVTGSQKTQNLVFPVTIGLDQRTFFDRRQRGAAHARNDGFCGDPHRRTTGDRLYPLLRCARSPRKPVASVKNIFTASRGAYPDLDLFMLNFLKPSFQPPLAASMSAGRLTLIRPALSGMRRRGYSRWRAPPEAR